MSTPKIWQGDPDEYIVETAKRGELQYGHLVNLATGEVGPEEPMTTIARFMPYTDFQPYDGDPAPILELVKAKAKA